MRLSPTLLWEMPSIAAVAQSVVDELASSSDKPAGEEEDHRAWASGVQLDPEKTSQLLAQIEHLSDQDVEVMLRELAA